MGTASDQTRRSFQTFCDGTSIHGFLELFHAKSTYWKVFWIVLLTTAIGLTTYQVTKAIMQYTNEETNLRTVPVLTNDMYPPLSLCMQHWLYWVDFEKAYTLNFTKQSVLYGMSFLSDIYASDGFEFESAMNDFNSAMVFNNFTKITEFYKKIAKNFPFDIYSPNSSLVLFQEITIFNSIFIGPTLCYTTPGKTIFDVVKDRDKTSFPEISFTVKTQTYSSVSEHITLNEYNWYMSKYLMTTQNYASVNDNTVGNFSLFGLYLLLFVDGYSQDYVPIIFEDDFYTISTFITVNRYQSDSRFKCVVGERSIRTNTSFCDQCKLMYDDTSCTCITLEKAKLSNLDFPDNLCQMKIFRLSVDGKQASRIVSEDDSHINVDELYCVKNDTLTELRNSCIKSCLYPCEIWSYSFSYVAERTGAASLINDYKKISTWIRIVYPRDDNIFIMVEVDRQSWEDFVANIGGLLGVWTGASLLSIVQLFYLCCFSHIEPKRILRKKANHVITVVTQLDDSNRVIN